MDSVREQREASEHTKAETVKNDKWGTYWARRQTRKNLAIIQSKIIAEIRSVLKITIEHRSEFPCSNMKQSLKASAVQKVISFQFPYSVNSLLRLASVIEDSINKRKVGEQEECNWAKEIKTKSRFISHRQF